MSRSEDIGRPRVPLEEARTAFVTAPFTRLARTHVFSVAGDALFTMGLAGTVFFDTDLDEARLNVALTLLLTIAPFAVAAPVIGPTLDRLHGGRRWMILGTCAGRALVSLLLVQNFRNLAFYPLAFAMLVLGKGYQIAKSALVPTTVHNDVELVEANSKLSLLSGLAVVVAAAPGALFWRFGGSEWVVGFAAVVFVAGAALAVKLPNAVVAAAPADDVEKQELRSVGILLAASGMGIMRAVVGFLAFLLAFGFKDDAAWMIGAVAASAQAGFLVGAAIAPRLRRLVQEEYILIGVLITTVVVGVGAAFAGGILVASIVSFVVGAGSSAGKQAFDAIVQRDAPDANRGRSFARFETRFQLMWVLGALLPVVLRIPIQLGFVVMAAVAGFGAISYVMGVRSASVRAASLLRALRRQRREEDDLAFARDLGFDVDEPADPEEPGGATSSEDGAGRPDRSRRRRSAAARRGTQRRHEGPPGDDEGPALVEPADGGDELVEHLADGEGPDLDWHPEY